MARVKRAVNAQKKRRVVLERASGYRGQRSRLYRKAKEQVTHSLGYAYRDRRARKGDFRRLWIQRINAAARANGMTYNRFIQGLKAAEVEVDRRMLAELAVNDEAAFAALVEIARAQRPGRGRAPPAPDPALNLQSAGTCPVLTNPRSDRVRAVRALSRRSVRARDRAGSSPRAPRRCARPCGADPSASRDLYLTAEARRRGTPTSSAPPARPGCTSTRSRRGARRDVRHRGPPGPRWPSAGRPTAALDAVLAAGAAAARAADQRARPGQRRHRDPRRRRRRRRRRAGQRRLASTSTTPKVVRSTAGSLFHLPVVTGLAIAATLAALRGHGMRLLAADGAGTDAAARRRPGRRRTRWVMGNEAWGLRAGGPARPATRSCGCRSTAAPSR